MQRVTVLAFGKPKGFYSDGIGEYEKRLRPYCRFAAIELPAEPLDEHHAGPARVAAALEKEGEKLLAAVPKGAALAALCVEGQPFSSEQLAAELARWAQQGGHLAFAIGSSHGLSAGVKQAAALRLSMGNLTLPHQMARLLLTEQLYRAYTILSGGKYNK